MPEQSNPQELDFNSDEYNSFYYTNDKQIKRMDDEYILSKITEKYPDFNKGNTENSLKQVLLLIVSDVALIQRLQKDYDIQPTELLKTIYRNYDFVFNKCFVNRIQKTIKNKKYARLAAKNGHSSAKNCRRRPGKTRKGI